MLVCQYMLYGWRDRLWGVLVVVGGGGVSQACGLDLSDGSLQCCSQPAMVANTHALDVIQVQSNVGV
jgi:hypothetical protein